jgi:hypothetical protein
MNVNYTATSLERRSTRKIHLPEERFIANQGAHELTRGNVSALCLRDDAETCHQHFLE